MKDRLLGLAVVLVAIGLYWFGRDLKAPISYEPVGPRAFPMMLAGLLAVAGFWLLLRGGTSGSAAATPVPAEPVAAATADVEAATERLDMPMLGLGVILTLIAVAFYAGLFETLGFIVATAAMAIAVGRLFGGRWGSCIVVGVSMGIGLFILFDKLLDVTLPLGLLRSVL